MTVKTKVKTQDVVEAPAPAEVEAVVLATEDVALLADEYGSQAEALEKSLKKLEPLSKKLAAIRSRLDEVANQSAKPEQKVTIRGAATEIEYGKKANKVVSKDLIKARKLLGDETYHKLVDITVGDLEKYLTPPQQAQVLTREATGNRSFKVSKAAKG